MRRLLLLCLALGPACKVKDPPPVREPWTDNFGRDSIGPDYYSTGSGYDVASGALSARGAHNHPLWLRKKLPRDIRIELDCWSNSPAGDIKVELFGDGHSYDPDGGRYLATGYELIFGGWSNSRSIIARLDEHAPDVVQRREPRVEPGRRYHWKIERKGKLLRWYIDDMSRPFLELDDARPLEGTGHDYFGFNNWETDTWFDNLVVSPL